MLGSLRAALSMYTRIPVPGFRWNEKDMRYMLGFFPAAGVLCGALFMVCFMVCMRLGTGAFLKGALLLAVTVSVTGGIHLDGFCDVHDALASYAGRDRRRAIMKDPHAGAFAVIHVCLYMILLAAGYSCIYSTGQAAAAACGFVLSRSLSGLCAFAWEKDLLEGSLRRAAELSAKKASVCILAVFAAVSAAGILAAGPVYALSCAAMTAACLYRYRRVCMESFGGFNGDCAGWLLARCELSFAYAVVFSEYFVRAVFR